MLERRFHKPLCISKTYDIIKNSLLTDYKCFPQTLALLPIEISHLQKLQNRTARIITVLMLQEDHLLGGWRTIEELIGHETKTTVFKSLHGMAQEYLCNLFNRNLQCSTHSLRSKMTGLRLPRKTSANGQKRFS